MPDHALDRTIRLPDGRTLGYLEAGDSDAAPVLLFHGSPGSRLDGTLIDPAALGTLRARLIAPDRPGLGRSDFQPGRTLRDWPADVRALADALGLRRFAVMGFSGGGPYAAVCAHDLADRLTAVALVSAIAPWDAPGVTDGMGVGRHLFRLARRAPWLLERLLGLLGRQLRSDPEPAMRQIVASLATPDQALMRAQPALLRAFTHSMREVYRQGARGAVHDLALHARPWGFPLENVRLPVDVWQGEADTNVPPAMGRYLARAIPSARAHFFPAEGHFMFVNHIQEIFGALLGGGGAS
ncbi:MAG: alpha/beta hydrolase [Chloroflexales bacterium]|nr:alpha/beta hydrolase [Chloroflexales bacterium]